MAAQFSQTTRSLRGDSSGIAMAVWSAAGILLTMWMAWFTLSSITIYEVSTSARLEVRQASHPVASTLAGKVAVNRTKLGADVEAGQILIELDTTSEQLRLREEQTRLRNIPPQMRSLQREIETQESAKLNEARSAVAAIETAKSRSREAEAALDLARASEGRLRSLNAGGWVTTADLGRATSETRRLSAARDAIAADAQRVEMDAEVRARQHDAQIETLRRQVSALEGDIANAEATIGRLNGEIEKHLIRATIDGRVGELAPLSAGSYVAEGAKLATIVPHGGDMIVVADFAPSLALGRVREGQQSRLRLDGFPWAQFGTIPATVSRVGTEIRDNRVRVEFDIDGTQVSGELLQHGLPGSIEVGIEKASPLSMVLRAAGVLMSSAPGRRPGPAI